MGLAREDRVFVPLCGKTLDIAWLLAQGHRVAGAELSEVAIRDLFEALGTKPSVSKIGSLKHYSATALDIFVGDIFDLTTEALGPVQVVFDRAALVALPAEMRTRYADHLATITQYARQMLITFEYDQDAMSGPPFSVPDPEVHQHYSEGFEIEKLSSADVDGGLKGICPALETLWAIRPKA